MQSNSDKILCKGLVCECAIGFHHKEDEILQKLVLDFEAEIEPIPERHKDSKSHIPLDYSIAIPEICKLIQSRRYNLIETVGEDVAALLLEKFSVQNAKVTVTKRPLNWPEGMSVSYECVRSRNS